MKTDMTNLKKDNVQEIYYMSLGDNKRRIKVIKTTTKKYKMENIYFSIKVYFCNNSAPPIQSSVGQPIYISILNVPLASYLGKNF